MNVSGADPFRLQGKVNDTLERQQAMREHHGDLPALAPESLVMLPLDALSWAADAADKAGMPVWANVLRQYQVTARPVTRLVDLDALVARLEHTAANLEDEARDAETQEDRIRTEGAAGATLWAARLAEHEYAKAHRA